MIEREILNTYGKKMIGFITDGAPVFQGPFKGFKALINESIPGIVNIHCLAHCTDLVGKKSYSRLTYDIDSFLTILVTYFSKSSTNKATFIELQKKLDFEPINILAISKTRWLKLFSMHRED